MLEDAALPCGERVAGAGAVCGLDDDDPFKGAVEAFIGRGQAEGRPLAAEAERLVCRMADFMAKGVEPDVGAGIEAAFGFQAQLPEAAAGVDTRFAIKITRRFRDPFADQHAIFDVRLAGADGQGQAHFGGFGNADFFADQIISEEIELHAAHRIGGNGQRKWQDKAVIIAIIHDLPFHDRQQMRNGPDKGADGGFGNVTAVQHIDLRRQASIPGIAPIDMPARIEVHLDRGIECFTGLNAFAFGNQLDHGPAPIDGLGVGNRHHRHQGGEKRQGESSDHERSFRRHMYWCARMPAIGRRMKGLAQT